MGYESGPHIELKSIFCRISSSVYDMYKHATLKVMCIFSSNKSQALHSFFVACSVSSHFVHPSFLSVLYVFSMCVHFCRDCMLCRLMSNPCVLSYFLLSIYGYSSIWTIHRPLFD